MIDQDTIHADLRELIKATDNVSVIQEAKNFLRALVQIDEEAHDSIVDEIVTHISKNIDAGIIYDAGNSDDPVHNVFSELNKAWSYGVNEYLKTWRSF